MVMLILTFVMGLVSIYMLYDVKQQHKNKLGSYQELIYFFTKDRSLVFVVSIVYLIHYMNLSGFALNYSSKQICSFLYRFFFAKEVYTDDIIWLNITVICVVALLMLPFTVFQDYQNYSKLTYILAGCIAMGISCTIIQIIVCKVDQVHMTPEKQEKYKRIYNLVLDSYSCNHGVFTEVCIRQFETDWAKAMFTTTRVAAA